MWGLKISCCARVVIWGEWCGLCVEIIQSEACGEVSCGNGLGVCVCDCICWEVWLVVMVFRDGVFVVDGGAFKVGVCWFVLVVLWWG